MNLELFQKNRSQEWDEIKIWAWTSHGSFFVSDKEVPGADLLIFSFWKINSSSWDFIEEECLEDYHVSEMDHFLSHNQEKMKRVYLRYLFRDWSFPERLEREDGGWLTESSFQTLLSLHPKILRILASNLERYSLSEEDLSTITKQSHLLFKKGGSVASPHKMISLYCTLTDMWNKFGLNYFDLQKMPIYERNALKRIIYIEKQIEAQDAKQRELQTKSKSMGRNGFRGGR